MQKGKRVEVDLKVLEVCKGTRGRQVQRVPWECLDQKDCQVSWDLKGSKVQKGRRVLSVHQERKASPVQSAKMVQGVTMVKEASKDFLAQQVPQVLLARSALWAREDLLASKGLKGKLEGPETKECRDLKDLQVNRVLLGLLGQGAHLESKVSEVDRVLLDHRDLEG